MLAEHDVIVGEQGIDRASAQVTTWHEAVYGPHIPSAEHFRTAEAAFTKFVEVNDAYGSAIEEGILEEDGAQDYANRVARFELGMRQFCRSADVNPKRATLDILIGRSVKYTEVWEEAKARVIAAGHEPTVALIKDACRNMWGKWQFTTTDEEHAALEVGRPMYEQAIQAGFPPEDAQELVKLYLVDKGFATERAYVTQSGESRLFDVTKYLGLKPGLEGIVESSREFEALTGQGPIDSMRQLRSEMGEVVELRSFFYIKDGETPGEPAQMSLKFSSIEEFHDHITQEAEAGIITEGEYNRYIRIRSLEELQRYIQEHLAYECIDVVVAAGGLLHRIPADFGLAVVDAELDRERYEGIVPVIQNHLPEGVSVTPGVARQVIHTAEALPPGLAPEEAVPIALALLANGGRFENDPDLLLR